jgi:hypothetical protein
MSQPEYVKDPSVEFVKSRLLGALMTSQDTTCRHTVYQYVQIPIFNITHLEYSSYTQTLFMGFLLLSEQNTMKHLLNSFMVDLYGQKLTYTKVDLVLCSDKAG